MLENKMLKIYLARISWSALLPTRSICPKGTNWIDSWTGIKHAGKQTLKCNIPENRGGPLFIKSGAIIPCQKTVPYIGDQPTETIILKVYPEGQSSYKGMPKERTYELEIAVPDKPKQLSLNGKLLENWKFDEKGCSGCRAPTMNLNRKDRKVKTRSSQSF
jgi:hypothetical protein